MSELGRKLSSNNHELVHYILKLKQESEEIGVLLKKQEEEKMRLQNEAERITYKLTVISKSMAQRVKIKQCYDKTIEEAEHNYNQLELSSGLLLDSVKKAANQLDETMDKKVGTDSDIIKPEDVLPEKDNHASDAAERAKRASEASEKAKRASEASEKAKRASEASEKAKRDSEVAERDEKNAKRKASSEKEKFINRLVDGLEEADDSPDAGISNGDEMGEDDPYDRDVRKTSTTSDSISSSEDEEEREKKKQKENIIEELRVSLQPKNSMDSD